jgi:ribonuclease BN (tRNA processing enzyme)
VPVKVTVIGSGDAFNGAGRGNACNLVEDSRGAFCVDFGPTALMELKQQRFEPDKLDAVFVTHLHGDHFGGLHLLLIDAQYRAFRKRPLTICGPVGIGAQIDAWYELAYRGSAAKREFQVRYVELVPGRSARVLGRKVTAFPAAHMGPTDGSLSLRIETDGATLAFSGDTGWTEAMPELADGADLLISECAELNGEPAQHISWERLEPRLGELKAKRIVLAHLGEAVRRKLSRLSSRKVEAADDGSRYVVRSRKLG